MLTKLGIYPQVTSSIVSGLMHLSSPGLLAVPISHVVLSPFLSLMSVKRLDRFLSLRYRKREERSLAAEWRRA